MTWPKVEEINANTNAARDEIKGNTDTAKNEIKTYTAEEIAAAIQTLQAATESARDMILAGMPTGGGLTSCIRKIQRGTVSFAGDEYTKAVTLSGFSSLSKMFVILNGARSLDEDSSSCSATYISVQGQQAYLSELTVTKLTVGLEYYSTKYDSGAVVSYQVIEFY